MPCYGVGKPFEYIDLWKDPLYEQFHIIYEMGVNDGIRCGPALLKALEENKKQIRDTNTQATKEE